MPLINCKIHIELNWSKGCVLANTNANTTLKITNRKLYVPVVTLSSKGSVKLVEPLEEGFKRPVYWNEYQTKTWTKSLDHEDFPRFPLEASFQGVRRLFLLVFNNIINNASKVEKNSHQKSCLPRVKNAN